MRSADFAEDRPKSRFGYIVSDSESERPRKILQPENDRAQDIGNERHSQEFFARSMFILLCAILGLE